MLSLGVSALGAILELADDDSSIFFGYSPDQQAELKASCRTQEFKPPYVVGIEPTNYRESILALSKYEGDMKIQNVTDYTIPGKDIDFYRTTQNMPPLSITIEDLPPTCLGKVPTLEPCVPHNPETPNYFQCKFTGSDGEVRIAPRSHTV